MSSDVPEEWSLTTLGKIATLSGGTTPSRAIDAYWSGGVIPWATPSDITSLPEGEIRISQAEGKVTALALEECSLRLHLPGSVLMTSRATIGFAVVNDVPMSTNQGFLAFQCGDNCDAEFLCQWLNANRDSLIAAASGSTFKELGQATAKRLPIFLPPLDEQQRITEVLRSVDQAIIAHMASNAQTLRIKDGLIEQLLKKGLGSSIVDIHRPDRASGWKRTALRDVLSIKHGFAFSSKFFLRESNGTVLLTPGNFKTDKSLYFGSNTKFYDGPIPDGYVLKNGDLLVVMTDLTQDMAILGNAVRLSSPHRVLHNQRIGKVECLDPKRIDKEFARFLLNSCQVQRIVKATASGTTVRHTSPGKILEIEVELPPLEEQKEIVSIARALEIAREGQSAVVDKSVRGSSKSQLVETREAIRADLLSGRVRVPA